MTPVKRKRVRRPRELSNTEVLAKGEYYAHPNGCVAVYDTVMTLKMARRLHAWLGRAIKYLEQGERR